jgi:DNA-binding transcriptional LysR family regulator
MELRQLKTFRTVATLNSFNQAANVLNYAQSTVSEQIKMLEQDLNVRLFKRAGKHIILTEAGELLLEYAQKMLDIEEEIKAEISDREEVHGALSIRVPETVSIYYLPSVLQQFHQRFPKVRMDIDNCTYSGLPQELQSGITNLAFLLIPGALRLPQVEAEILRKIPLVVVAHPDHPLTSQRHVGFQDLKNELILLAKTDCSYRSMFEQSLAKELVESAVLFNFNSIEALKQCAMAGTGITVISEIAVQKEIAEGRLVALPWKGKKIYVNLFMIWQKNKWLSPTLKAFMDMTREHVSASSANDK